MIRVACLCNNTRKKISQRERKKKDTVIILYVPGIPINGIPELQGGSAPGSETAGWHRNFTGAVRRLQGDDLG